jgi:hypothetical protein
MLRQLPYSRRGVVSAAHLTYLSLPSSARPARQLTRLPSPAATPSLGLSLSLAAAYMHARHGCRDEQLLPPPFLLLQAPSRPTTSTTSFALPSFSRNRRVLGPCRAATLAVACAPVR